METQNINNNIEQKDNNLINDIIYESINASEFNKISNLSEFKSLSLYDLGEQDIEFVKLLIELGKFSNITVGNSFKLLSAFMIYKGVVTLYSKIAFTDNQSNFSESKLISYNIIKERKIKHFMFLGAPVIVGLFLIGNEITKPMSVNININLNSQITDSKSNTPNKIIASSL